MQKIFLAFLCLTYTYSTKAQVNIDSLIAIYPTQSNKKKAITLGELCYQLAFNDTKKAINYGRLGYEAAIKTKDQETIATSLNDWSIPYLVQGDFEKVIDLCDQAMVMRIEMGDSVGLAKLLNKMANANYELGDLSLALKQNLRALKIFEKNDLPVFAGRLLSNIGNIYESNGMFDSALEMYQKGKQIAFKNKNESAYYIALSSEATCLTKLNKFKEADQKLNEALTYYLKIKDIDMLGGVYQNLGYNARLDKNSTKGQLYYKKAFSFYKQNNNETGMLFISTNLAQVAMDAGELISAEENLNIALKLALKNKSSHQLETIYRGLIRLENLKGNFTKADEYFELYQQQMDSLYNAETNMAISDMKIKYDTDSKTKALENERLENKNNQLLLFLAAVLIAILVLLIVLIRHRKKLQSEKLELKALKNLENERSRIARDLHDNLGAELALIGSKIDIAAYKSENTLLTSSLNQISGLSKNANHQLRETIWSIHKTSVTLGELSDKIQGFTDRGIDDKDMDVKIINTEQNVEISPILGLNLFRISQEMINNSVKYSEAKSIQIELKRNILNIVDDGIGFDVANVRRGYGLNNIEQRVVEINGKMRLESGSYGTNLTIDF